MSGRRIIEIIIDSIRQFESDTEKQKMCVRVRASVNGKMKKRYTGTIPGLSEQQRM